MWGRWAGIISLSLVVLVAGACSSSEDPGPAGIGTTTTVSSPDPAATSTTVGEDGSVSGGSSRATTTTSIENGSTTTAPPDSTTTTPTTTTPPPSITTTAPPTTTTLAARPASAGCPQDLFLSAGARGAEFDTELAAFPAEGGEALWRIPLGYDFVADRDHDDSTVYAFLDSGLLIALDATTCAERWRLGLGEPVGLAIGEGVLIAVDDRAVRGIDTADGTTLWADENPPGPLGDPLVLEEFTLVPSAAGATVTAYWTLEGGRIYQSRLEGWSGPILGITADFTAWYVVGDGTIAGRWLDDGTVLFDNTLPFDPAPPALFSGTIYVAGTAGGTATVGAFDFDLGEEIWRVPLTGAAGVVATAPGVDHNELHVLDTAGRLHHLDLGDGSTVSVGSYPQGTVSAEFDDLAFLVADRGTIVVHTLREQEAARLPTGADGAARVTELDIVGDVYVTETYDRG